ncbi:MAG: hypothetical protein SFY80_09210 [Verrucomicrobiota bacterium]|nr:hypothetical protein [Verrucomicrobiota bacterium]
MNLSRLLASIALLLIPVALHSAPACEVPALSLPTTWGDQETVIVPEWLVVGPFVSTEFKPDIPSGINRTGFIADLLKDMGGETNPNLVATLAANAGKPQAPACVLLKAKPDGVADLTTLFGEKPDLAAYLVTTIQAPEAAEVDLLFGSDDSAKVWINGTQVFETWAPMGRACFPRTESFTAQLKKGSNTLLVKVDQMSGGFGACVEVLNPSKATAVLAPYARFKPVVTVNPKKKGEWDVAIHLGLNMGVRHFAGIPVATRIEDEHGKLVSSTTTALDATQKLTLPGGFYRVSLNCEKLDEAARMGETAFVAGVTADRATTEALASSSALIAQPKYEAYAGYFKYLQSRIDKSFKPGIEPDAATLTLAWKLSAWTNRASANSLAYADQRGAIEWGYVSQADGSGQPFTLRIPDDYNTAMQRSLLIYLHGSGGSHGQSWGDSHPKPQFELYVNGRGPTGGYVGLSGVDVEEALAFVTKHWAIDPLRIHLSGGSMGGFGTFELATRHPDWFATAVPWCGGGVHLPVENLLNLPVYALHSDDDPAVEVGLARGALRKLNEIGGTAIMAETTGLGHSVGQWKEGEAQMKAWAATKQKVNSREVRTIRYTAIDQTSRGAYWAQVIEWGGEGRPASMNLRVDADNTLFAELDNLNALEIDVPQSPLAKDRPLHVIVAGVPVGELPAPLPAKIILRAQPNGWLITGDIPAPLPRRLHYPGGSTALYHGEPLLIVWGTTGPQETTNKLEALARAGQKNSRINWSEPEWRQMPYGEIPAKADKDVTADDKQRCNLILLGNASENAIVASIADSLPVKIANNQVSEVGGRTLSLTNRLMGLLYYNPQAPQRMIYWIAASDPVNYRNDAKFFSIQAWGTAPDFIVTEADKPQLVVARRFDSHWQWEQLTAYNTVLGPVAGSSESITRTFAECMRRELGSDAGFTAIVDPKEELFATPGETTWGDCIAFTYYLPIATMEVDPSAPAAILAASKTNTGAPLPMFTTFGQSPIGRPLRLGLFSWDIGTWYQLTKTTPRSFRVSESTLRDALIHQEAVVKGQ